MNCALKAAAEWEALMVDITERGPPRSVFDLDTALQAYWNSRTPREDQAAYHEILLFGGRDGYGSGGWRDAVVRWLRLLALRIERR